MTVKVIDDVIQVRDASGGLVWCLCRRCGKRYNSPSRAQDCADSNCYRDECKSDEWEGGFGETS